MPPRGRASIWRADLVRLLAVLPAQKVEAAAAQLGFDRPKPQAVRRAPAVIPVKESAVLPGLPSQVQAAAPLPLFRLEEMTFSDAARPKGERPSVPELSRGDFYHPDYAMAFTPPSPPLSPWSRLWPVLHRGLRSQTPSRDPDLPKLVRLWSRGEVAARMPRLPRPAWAQRIAVWVDRSPRLVPFFSDQALVYQRLLRICGRSALTVRVLSPLDQATVVAQRSDHAAGQALDACQTVLVLGDLGAYGSMAEQDAWRRTQQRLARGGVRSMALLPVPRARWPQQLSRSWSAASWERGRTAQLAVAGAQGLPPVAPGVERLLRLLSPAEFVEPGLLRALRHLLPAGSTDASTEVEVYRHPDVRAADATGLVLARDAAAQHRQLFATDEPAEIKEQVSRTLAQFHARLPRQLVHFETLTWLSLVPAEQAPPPGSASDAQVFAARLATSMRRGSDHPELAPQLRRAAQSLLQSLPDSALAEQPVLQRLWAAAYAGVAGVRVPSGLDRKLLEEDPPGPPDAPLRHFSLRQVGDALVCRHESSGVWPSTDSGPGSPVAWLPTVGQHIAARWSDEPTAQWWPLQDGLRIPLRRAARLQVRTVDRTLTLVPWSREPWAVAAGRDPFGLWAEAEVEGIPLRFRWIPPGRFWMGSPENEAGRDADEGPQHEVTLTQGYWLADAPCTQALWQAVMGENPSRFQSPDRPVEQVSWDDCQEFVQRLNRALPGLSARLPSEAEWEHACRAGTQTATWLGDLEILGENNAPRLDPIAWYGGNSGQDYELEEGYDSSDWPNKQYAHSKAGTHPVRSKAPNPMGLFDVLGNVYEWCMDWYTPYSEEAITNPVLPSNGSHRVLRGGSWFGYARGVRAAYRNHRAPGLRDAYLGFRLARGQGSSQAGMEAEPRSGAARPAAGRGRASSGSRDATQTTARSADHDPKIGR